MTLAPCRFCMALSCASGQSRTVRRSDPLTFHTPVIRFTSKRTLFDVDGQVVTFGTLFEDFEVGSLAIIFRTWGQSEFLMPHSRGAALSVELNDINILASVVLSPTAGQHSGKSGRDAEGRQATQVLGLRTRAVTPRSERYS